MPTIPGHVGSYQASYHLIPALMLPVHQTDGVALDEFGSKLKFGFVAFFHRAVIV